MDHLLSCAELYAYMLLCTLLFWNMLGLFFLRVFHQLKWYERKRVFQCLLLNVNCVFRNKWEFWQCVFVWSYKWCECLSSENKNLSITVGKVNVNLSPPHPFEEWHFINLFLPCWNRLWVSCNHTDIYTVANHTPHLPSHFFALYVKVNYISIRKG